LTPQLDLHAVEETRAERGVLSSFSTSFKSRSFSVVFITQLAENGGPQLLADPGELAFHCFGCRIFLFGDGLVVRPLK